ncbi:MAG: SAM-dependent methyltransferase [Arcobacteraceae bacterium]|jgi:SAM-dependent MidA family methyltransferase
MQIFSDYFNDWLYGDDGYYSNYKTIGKDGDFFTAVSASKLFGGSIAKRIIDTIESGFIDKNTTILEIGAHHGYLMADIIQFIYTLKPELLKTLTFAICERYENLRDKQKQYLNESFGDAINFIHYSSLKDINLDNAIVVANEIFDAFPCELVYTKDDVLEQGFVENDKIIFQPSTNQHLIDICKKHHISKGEVSLEFLDFAKSLSSSIKKFEFITFDYGDEYPRNDFSCRIYSKHKVYPIFEDDLPLSELFKKSDITYDVNFAFLIDCFKQAGAKNIIYETQLKALVRFGIIELLEILLNNTDEANYLREANRVKTLLEPTGMGDRFKVAIFRK